MSDRSQPQSVMRFLLTAVVVAVLSSASAQTAQATCGDYLTHQTPTDSQQTHLLHFPDQRSPRIPCSGPGCQNHHPDQTPETPVVISTIFKPACAFSRIQVIGETPLRESTCGLSTVYSNPLCFRIDRPPQTAGI